MQDLSSVLWHSTIQGDTPKYMSQGVAENVESLAKELKTD